MWPSVFVNVTEEFVCSIPENPHLSGIVVVPWFCRRYISRNVSEIRSLNVNILLGSWFPVWFQWPQYVGGHTFLVWNVCVQIGRFRTVRLRINFTSMVNNCSMIICIYFQMMLWDISDVQCDPIVSLLLCTPAIERCVNLHRKQVLFRNVSPDTFC